MKELKCPKCGNVFTVDESDYADIVNQVKNAEFHAEVSRRLKEMEKQQALKQQTDILKAEQRLLSLASEKDAEIIRLKARIDETDSRIRVAVLEEQNKSKDALQKKEQKIAELKNELTANESKSLERVQSLKEMYDMQLKEKQTQIDYYKDLKTRMSTKMVGETL